MAEISDIPNNDNPWSDFVNPNINHRVLKLEPKYEQRRFIFGRFNWEQPWNGNRKTSFTFLRVWLDSTCVRAMIGTHGASASECLGRNGFEIKTPYFPHGPFFFTTLTGKLVSFVWYAPRSEMGVLQLCCFCPSMVRAWSKKDNFCICRSLNSHGLYLNGPFFICFVLL